MAETVVDLTKVDDPPKTVYVDADETCCFGFEEIKDGTTYWAPPCGHLFCGDCMKDKRLNVCTRCAQPFLVAEPVRVLIKNYTINIE